MSVMPIAAPKVFLLPDEYLAGEDSADVRHEYVAGEVYAMAGAGEQHNRIALNTAFQLRSRARGGGCGVFMSDMKLRVRAGERFYYPDVMLVCDATDDHTHYKDRPCLIAEVLSPATEATDRREKWLAYKAIPSLHYYLMIAADRQSVEYYQRDEAGEWQGAVLDGEQTLQVSCRGEGVIFQAELCLGDIYEDVRW